MNPYLAGSPKIILSPPKKMILKKWLYNALYLVLKCVFTLYFSPYILNTYTYPTLGVLLLSF